MPDHLHLVLPGEDPARMVRRLRAVLSSFSRVFKLGQLWERVPHPREIVGVDKARRQIRYVLLNPCRPFQCGHERHVLTDDPLAWPWSTARELCGAAVASWGGAGALAPWVGAKGGDIVGRLFSYVVGDPSVSAAARVLPQAATPSVVPEQDLGSIAQAVRAARRRFGAGPITGVAARQDFVALAVRQGWRDTGLLARACGVHRSTVGRILLRVPRPSVEAAAMCLGSARLRGSGRFELEVVRRG